jgi:HPr kinase/phosphorylase
VNARAAGGVKGAVGQDAATLHASALIVGEAGVLVRGPSGSGKSSLTLALLALAGDRRCFARLIGDDRVLVRSEGARILASGAPNMLGLIERRGYGIVRASAEPCAVIRLVVDLLPEGERSERLPERHALCVTLCGIALPRLVFEAVSTLFERSYGVLGYLDKIGDKNMTGFAHFA